jgi:transcriptional regulator with XRE-family HTH domain
MPIDAQAVASIRSRMGKTQEQMAVLCGVSIRTWRRWESQGASELVARFLERVGDEAA